MPAKKAAARPAQPPARLSSRPTSIYRLRDGGMRTINFGLFAWPGVGKSVFIGSGGPKMLILDSDIKGSDSAAAQGSEAYAAQVPDYDTLEEIYQWLRNDVCKKPREEREFTWVWWDSTTLFQDRTLIDELLADAYAQNPSKQDPDVPSQREYLKSQNKIARYVRQFSELDINFGMSFHVMAHETPDGEVMWCPLMQGGKNAEFSTKIQGYTNVLGFYYAKEVDKQTDRYLRTRSNQEYIAKDRFNALPPVMKNPTIPEIEKLVREARAKRASGAAAPVKRAVKKAARPSISKA